MREIAMSLYVQYHNYDKEGLWLNNAAGQFDIRTSLGHVQDAIGGRVFLIFGIGSPARYYLWNSFTVNNVEELVDDDGKTTYHATGPGWYLSPPQRLAGPEFDDFKKSCANFVEFRNVEELPFAGALKRLADQHRIPRSVAAVQSFVQELRQLLPVDTDRKRLADYFTKVIRGTAKQNSSTPELSNRQPQMRALSIRQPHAEAILRGVRKIEHRSGPTKVRGRIYVYASQSRYSAVDEAGMLEDYGIADVEADDLPRGVLVGTVELFDCKDGDWHVRNPERLDTFVKPKNHPQPVWFDPF